MPLSRRYTPELSPEETSVFGMDFSYVIPKGVGIASGTLQIFLNQNPLVFDDFGFLVPGDVKVQDRTLYAKVTATDGAVGTDFMLVWTATDTDGNIWPRAGLVLCAWTS